MLESVNRYFPDILPENVLEHFGRSERPAGELGKSALFSERSDESIKMLRDLNTDLKRENKSLKADLADARQLVRLQGKNRYELVQQLKRMSDVMPPEILKKIPEVLNNPIVITEYIDKNGIHSANV